MLRFSVFIRLDPCIVSDKTVLGANNMDCLRTPLLAECQPPDADLNILSVRRTTCHSDSNKNVSKDQEATRPFFVRTLQFGI